MRIPEPEKPRKKKERPEKAPNTPEVVPKPGALDDYFIAKLESAEGPAHARNKAKHYYRLCYKKGQPQHIRFAEKIKTTCQTAMACGDWKPVASMLADLW